MEYAIIVTFENGTPIYQDHVERKYAEENGLCHLTTIICIKVGNKILVHDRKQKQLLKHKLCNYSASYNLVGGHATFDDTYYFIQGKPVPDKFIEDSAKRELSEELLISCGSDDPGAVKINKFKVNGDELEPDGFCYGKPADFKNLEFIGYAKYNSSTNNEISACYILDMSERKQDIIMADDYEANNSKYNVLLPVHRFSLNELRDFSDNVKLKINDFEICDAITRLFSADNEHVLNRLNEKFHSACEPLCDHEWSSNDDGSFAAGGKVTTLTCSKCGKTHRYYSDTGTFIE